MSNAIPHDPRLDDPQDPRAARSFTRMVKAARPQWQPFYVNPRKHVAKAILLAERGGFTVALTYEGLARIASIEARLGPISPPSEGQLQAMLRPRAATGLTAVGFDGEDRMLHLRATSVICPYCNHEEFAVQALLRDLKNALDGQTIV